MQSQQHTFLTPDFKQSQFSAMAVTCQEVQCGTDWLRWLPLMNLPVVDLWGVRFWDYRLFLSCALWSPSSPSILVRLCEFEKGAVPMAAWNLQFFGRLKTKITDHFYKNILFLDCNWTHRGWCTTETVSAVLPYLEKADQSALIKMINFA